VRPFPPPKCLSSSLSLSPAKNRTSQSPWLEARVANIFPELRRVVHPPRRPRLRLHAEGIELGRSVAAGIISTSLPDPQANSAEFVAVEASPPPPPVSLRSPPPGEPNTQPCGSSIPPSRFRHESRGRSPPWTMPPCSRAPVVAPERAYGSCVR